MVVGLGAISLDDDFGNKIANILRRFIEEITPMVDEFENQRNEEDA